VTDQLGWSEPPSLVGLIVSGKSHAGCIARLRPTSDLQTCIAGFNSLTVYSPSDTHFPDPTLSILHPT
jgi:hypothetical protein